MSDDENDTNMDLLAMCCGLTLGIVLGLAVTSGPAALAEVPQKLCVMAMTEAGGDAGNTCGPAAGDVMMLSF
jgi:hypothetical protein